MTSESFPSSWSPSTSSSGPAAARLGITTDGRKDEGGIAGPLARREAVRMVTRSCDEESGWNVRPVRAQTFESCASENDARGGICGAGAESAAVPGDVACDAGDVEVVAVEDEAFENIGVGVPAIGKERPQWSIAPSEPPETTVGCMGCNDCAMLGPFVGTASGHQVLARIEKGRHTENFFLSVYGGRATPS